MTTEIDYFRLASLKSQLKLEAVGLKSSGGAIRPRIAKEFNLSPRAPYTDYIKAIQILMDKAIAERAAQND